MDKYEMLKQREENYKKWFERWIKKYDLKKQIEVANNKNYVVLSIQTHAVEDKRDKIMMADDKFISMLEEEFPDFKITREKKIRDRYLLGNKIGKLEINKVYIDWS